MQTNYHSPHSSALPADVEKAVRVPEMMADARIGSGDLVLQKLGVCFGWSGNVLGAWCRHLPWFWPSYQEWFPPAAAQIDRTHFSHLWQQTFKEILVRSLDDQR